MGDNWASLCLYCFSASLLNCNLLPPLCALYGFLLYSLASAWQLNWSVLDMCVCLCVWSLLCIQASVYPCMPTWSVRVLLFSCNSSSLCLNVCLCVCVSKHCWTCNAVLCILLCPPQKNRETSRENNATCKSWTKRERKCVYKYYALLCVWTLWMCVSVFTVAVGVRLCCDRMWCKYNRLLQTCSTALW